MNKERLQTAIRGRPFPCAARLTYVRDKAEAGHEFAVRRDDVNSLAYPAHDLKRFVARITDGRRARRPATAAV
eukprot:2055679-Prymnesium_polylepis.1